MATTKNDSSQILDNLNSAIARLDEAGTNDMVTMALIIVGIAQDSLKANKAVPGADALFEIALDEFKDANGREPDWD